MSVFAACDENPTLYAFLCEQEKWPVVHFTIPFIFYIYFRDLKLNICLMAIWEYIEAATGLSGSLLFFAATATETADVETVSDSVFSDGTVGLAGTLTAMGLVCLFEIPEFRAPLFPGTEFGWTKLWLKHIFQLALFAAPTFVVAMVYDVDSLGHLIMMFYEPALFVLVMLWWNAKDPLRGVGSSVALSRLLPYEYDYYRIIHVLPDQKKAREKFVNGNLAITAFLMIFLTSFFRTYLSVFVMVCIHGGISLFVVWTLVLLKEMDKRMAPLSPSSPSPSSPQQEPPFEQRRFFDKLFVSYFHMRK